MPASAPARRLTLILVAAATVLPGCLENVEAPGPILPDTTFAEPTRVEVHGTRLYVDDRPFVVKGVVYSPVPPGVDPERDLDYHWLHDAEVWKRDLALLKEMGANTVRIVHAHGDPAVMRPFLDEAARLRIMVIMGHPGPMREDAGEPAVRERTLREVRDLVAAYRDHPAVLMWLVGNEVNYWYPEGKDVRDWYTLLEEVAQEAHRLDAHHPVATANNALADVEHFVALSPSVDVYGTNQYLPEASEFEENLLPGFRAAVPGKPLLITEFGADAWDLRRDREDTETQARVVRENWETFARHTGALGPLVGACVFEWSDEWWKGGNPDEPDPRTGWEPPQSERLPDRHFSEAYFGVVRPAPDGRVERRDAYFALQQAWASAEEPSPPAFLDVRSTTDGNRITVAAEVVAYGGEEVDVSLHYRVRAGAWQQVPMQPAEGRTWEARLGPFEDGVVVVFYRIQAVDESGRGARSPEGTVHAVPGPSPLVVAVAALAVAGALAFRREARR